LWAVTVWVRYVQKSILFVNGPSGPVLRQILGLRSGLKFGDNFLAITSTACAILESSDRSLSTLSFVIVIDSTEL